MTQAATNNAGTFAPLRQKVFAVLWVATILPIGAIDMAHWEHCKSVVTGEVLDGEVQTLNRIARRAGPVLLPVGAAIALLGVAGAVLTSLC